MNKKLLKLIRERVLEKQMNLDETIEYVWELKEAKE